MRWLVITFSVLFSFQASARDAGQWEAEDSVIREWYRGLMMPDIPTASCCGESDAYWCDDISVRGGKTFCKITDDRGDASRHRPHRSLGQEFEIPDHKLKYDRGNPTGHAIIFLSPGDIVFCFVQGTGI